MKKLLLIVVILTISLGLSGCGELTQDLKDDNYYTKEEVDLMFEELGTDGWSTIQQQQSVANARLDELESLLRDFERFEYEDLLEFEEYFYGDFKDELDVYLEENYQPLEECDIDCAIEQIDRDIMITTIAQIDLALYGLENSDEPLSEEEQFVYDLYITLREELYSEIEGK